jgi:hypothetical protein
MEDATGLRIPVKTARRCGVPLTCLVALVLLTAGCPKVRPGAYQLGVQAYYKALLSETTEESLRAAIASLNRHLEKNPADAGMLALRASGHLDLLRLSVQRPGGAWNTAYAAELFRDLRLLEALTDQQPAPPWLRPRLHTTAGDAFLLCAESLRGGGDGRSVLLQAVRQGALYRLAADFYQHAWAAAQTPTAEAGAAASHLEKSNARDGYTSALAGLAKVKRILGFEAEARDLAAQAIALLVSAGAPLPTPETALSPRSLYAYSHALLKTQYETVEALSRDSFRDRIAFAEAALKEDLASRILKSPPEDVTFGDEPAAARLLSYYGALSVRAERFEVTGAGDSGREVVSLRLIPDGPYAAAGIHSFLDYVTLVSATQKARISLQMPVPATGLELSIRTGQGQPGAQLLFLGRNSPLFAPGDAIRLLGPDDRQIGAAVAR